MKVVATSPGFYGGSLHAPGDEFDVDDKAKASWFAPVDGVAPKAKAKDKAKDKEPTEPATLSQLAAEKPQTMAEVLA